MVAKALKQFKLYAPSLQKNYELNPDGTLTIEGIASTSNKDLQGDIVLPSAIKSMKQQLLTSNKNLHGDHEYRLKGIIGAITEVLDSDENSLKIKAIIRSKFAPEIKEMLDIGINLGLSIGGKIKEHTQTNDGWEIKDINLLEISLTGMPANWDTFGTIIASDGMVHSKCLTGACHVIRKTLMEDTKMAEENNPQSNEPNDSLTKDDVIDLFNELMANKQEEIARDTVDQVRKEIESVVQAEIEKLKQEDNGEEGKPNEPNNDDSSEKMMNQIQDSIQKVLEDSIQESIQKSVEESMSNLFKDLNQNRDPHFKVDDVKEKDLNNDNDDGSNEEDKGLTSKQIAEQLYKSQGADALINSLLEQ